MDKFFSLYMLAFTIIVIPLFYLNGDMKFRTDLANSGYITALKNALKWIKDKIKRNLHLNKVASYTSGIKQNYFSFHLYNFLFKLITIKES